QQCGCRLFFRTKQVAKLVTAETRQHDVKDDEGGLVFGDRLDRLITAVADCYLEAVAFEDFFEAEQDVRIVFDDQDFSFHNAPRRGSRTMNTLPPPSRGSHVIPPP